MARMRQAGKIDYIEFRGGELISTKRFYADAFGWRFQDFGPTYAAFEGAGIDGGFQADPTQGPAQPLVILYDDDLEGAADKVVAAGGQICVPIFAFPGGRRFHFRDPAGNELAVWSET